MNEYSGGEFGEKEIEFSSNEESFLDFSEELERIKQRRKQQLLQEQNNNIVEEDIKSIPEEIIIKKNSEFSLKNELIKLSIASVGLLLAITYFSKAKTTTTTTKTASPPPPKQKRIVKLQTKKEESNYIENPIENSMNESDTSHNSNILESPSLVTPPLGWINTPVATTRRRRSITKINNTTRRHSSRLMELKGKNYQLNNI